ncbi:MAG: AraC family transcriptional regulator [Verrucomicrobiales bacterium]|jgi:transcriptional regulator GlxA family with amidase domain|nr:AraC family transcriptional regulator [Verrucomicrobiales bacterium]
MTASSPGFVYPKITPASLYINRREPEAGLPSSGNSFMDLLAKLLMVYGRRSPEFHARKMGLVKHSDFNAAIRAMTGLRACDWIDEYIHIAACDLLRNTDRSITLIARQLGFSSIATFSQFFRRIQRQSPYAYRHNGATYHFP